MTEKRLKEYGDICAELNDVCAELTKLETSDSVQSANIFPYSKRSVRVSGLPPNEETQTLLKRQAELKTAKAEIEEYISGVSDHQTRRMLEMRYLQGKTYLQIAMKLTNGRMSQSGVRMRIKRFFQNF